MFSNKLEKQALKVIFGDPKSLNRKYDQVVSHAQNVIDIIFQTQTYLLGIKSDAHREAIIEERIYSQDRNNSLVNELRFGYVTHNYKTVPVDELLMDNTEENNAFWEVVKTLLTEAVLWNYQPDVIKESLKQKVLMYFYTDPSKSLPQHATFLKNALLKKKCKTMKK